MPIRHADAADDGAHDSNEPLIGSAQEHVGQVGCAVELFIRSAVNCAVVVPREPADCLGREDVGVDHVRSEIWHKPDRRLNGRVVLNHFLGLVLFFR